MKNKNGVDLDTSDWVSDTPYTNADCKAEGRFNTPEYVEEACVNVECTEAKMTHCGANTPGERYVVQNGEAILVACEPENNWSEWSDCVPTCADREPGTMTRFSDYGDEEEEDCPKSTIPCPTWGAWTSWSDCANDQAHRNRTCITGNFETHGDECAGDSQENCPC